ncbi:unnamed protein product [Eruca vesicaria subsp. sativa]|uniref:Uncharacterized protein n=1 Tax=Eruca vesicaria subsp. sativa TaxID=29727 RepID=A0ABC8JYQ4_ERUVS|nr:unnamed protein product [Eruca vesicaria subsp. sativa]
MLNTEEKPNHTELFTRRLMKVRRKLDREAKMLVLKPTEEEEQSVKQKEDDNAKHPESSVKTVKEDKQVKIELELSSDDEK